ncbi:alginate lyase family protein [Buttiauxella noackiae]|uniref:Alginate lyase n=1 Tax=Buttiauxella noackiae ATCC 51607 TaxID=1354255 RepID=A0A1B7HTG7_9ENTR|nr:alginate lyase family protein [Buttiauxella noackiae]MCA1920592.1 alginate lyase family protein [Buttiauxella noackiae]OAT18933.1 alginate lyase [Buttiauxella noackiae ATCC 51607]
MKLYTLDVTCLENARRCLQQPFSPLQLALGRLVSEADKLRGQPPESVVHKKLRSVSGDPHDYYSLGTYWWPNPRRPNGLPYIRRDGHTNPQCQNNDTDTTRIIRMCERCLTLGLAWYFTGHRKYAQAAAEQIKCWFLDEKTRMNPHLNYGQAIPGIVSGRGTGLIDTRLLWMVIDTIGLISPAGVLDTDDIIGLHQWFRDFNHWMFYSDVGHSEYVWHNNHGTWYDAQRAANALFYGDKGLVARIIQQGITQRMAAQIDQEGKQTMELERPVPFHYSLFNLEAHLLLNRYAEHVEFDRWDAVQDGRSVKLGIDYLMPFIADPDLWPYSDLQGIVWDSALRLLLQSMRGYPKEKARYKVVLASFPEETLSLREQLMWCA